MGSEGDHCGAHQMEEPEAWLQAFTCGSWLGSPEHTTLPWGCPCAWLPKPLHADDQSLPPPPPPLYSQCPAGWRQGLLHGPSDFRASWAELLELCSALLLRLPPPLPRFTSSSCKACFKDIIKPALSPVNAQQLPVLLSEPCPKHLETAMSLGSTQAIH